MNTVAVDTRDALAEALAAARNEIVAIDATCSRFREDSELSRLNRAAGRGPQRLSPLLEEAIVAAIQAARMTGGLVDPTVGQALREVGYTLSFGDLAGEGPALALKVRPVLGVSVLDYDTEQHTLGLPEDVSLDLGASGKAWAADRAAAAAARATGQPVLVECGGDVAISGPRRQGGWPVRVAADVDATGGQDVSIFDGGLATSGTNLLRWRRGDAELHHIIDPATGLPARSRWSMVSVAAASCLEANAAATAALIMGERALNWLNELCLPARLVDQHGAVHVAGGWSS